MSKVCIAEVGTDLPKSMADVFEGFGGARKVLNGRDKVFVKINAVELKPHCYTPPDFVEALVRHLFQEGARRVYVMDNCTQGTFTRLVFHATGISKAVRRAGGKVLFLDEGPVERIAMPPAGDAGLGAVPYDQQEIGLPRIIVEELIRNRDSVAYINVPKFKTHCMTKVTLGIKNQWGLVVQKDRIADHNHLLPRKLVDILGYVRPDFTLIDAREATQHGHYPSQRLLDRILVPYGLVIGGKDVVSVDAVGCNLMGFPWQDVEHVRLAHERNLGTADLDRIEVIGDLARHRKELSWELLPVFPKDVDVHKGEELCCREGCASNVMASLQVLSLDFQGKGGFSVVMGKGWDPSRLEKLQERVLVVGKCAVAEVGERLRSMRSPDSLAWSDGCNNLTATITCLLKWMKVPPLRMVPVDPLRSSLLLLQARSKGSTAAIPPLWIR
jgi:uncharacterized protein (DUF362 family)